MSPKYDISSEFIKPNEKHEVVGFKMEHGEVKEITIILEIGNSTFSLRNCPQLSGQDWEVIESVPLFIFDFLYYPNEKDLFSNKKEIITTDEFEALRLFREEFPDAVLKLMHIK